MRKLGKRVEKHSKKLGIYLFLIIEFALLFWKHSAYKCFEAPQNNYQSCKDS